MKLRTSFVSNSSSASYMVTMDVTMEEFCRDLRRVNWPEWTSDRDYQSQVTKQIVELYSDSQNDPEAKEQAKLLERVLIGFGTKTPDEKLIQILEHRGITVAKRRDGPGIGLEYFTGMHNCYTEGVPKLFKEIILHFLFELKGKKWMDFEVEHQGDYPDDY